MSTLLQINNLEMAYGTQIILHEANLSVSEKQKIAVVGRNGAGKSTLFRLIIGQEEPTEGEILVHKNTRIGYLTQHSPFRIKETVMEFLQRDSGRENWFCAKIAGQFQIKTDLFNVPVTSLAGGYQMRVKLIGMLAKEPNLLLLDEPTNYLDLSTQLLLEHFLKRYNGAFMLISHDREFIRKTCQQTLEIENGKIYLFPQSLEEYFQFKKQRQETIERTNQKTLQEKARLQTFIDRFGAKASKASQAKSKMRQIERLEIIETDSPLSTTKIRIPKLEDKKGVVLKIAELAIGYPEKTVATKINFQIDRGERIAVVGDNGQGKTTFLKTISGELEKVNGKFSWGHNIQVGYYAQHTPSTLQLTTRVGDYLIQTAPKGTSHQDIFEMAGNFLFKDDALKKEISVLSGGEKARLCLASILLQKNHVLLLDEPTNHLDFETVEALAEALSETNTTVIFVSHNRTFVENLATGIVEVKSGRASRYHHNYSDYVYHLRRTMEDELGITEKSSSPKSTEADSKNQAEEKRQQRKKISNQLRKIESTIKGLETEKHQINAWFEANPTNFDDQKSSRLGKIQDDLTQAENEWLELQQRLEELF